MEKTMRWWSDCTANWRDKWSKVRSERNRYKEEAKRLASRLEAANHEVNKSRGKSEEVDRLRERLRQELNTRPNVRSVSTNTEAAAEAEVVDTTVTSANFLFSSSSGLNKPSSFSPLNNHSGASVDSGLAAQSSSCNDEHEHHDQLSRFLDDSVSLAATSEQQNMVKFRLEEALKTVEAERSDKQGLVREIDSLQDQVSSLESTCDELRVARQEASRELLCARNQSQDTIRVLQLQLEEQQGKKNSSDQVIGHLREEVSGKVASITHYTRGWFTVGASPV